MKRFLLVPDSFKGTLSSKQICKIMKSRITAYDPTATVTAIPVADGGEGSVDCFLSAAEGVKVDCASVDPFFEPMEGFYGLLDNGKTAVIEMAACAGLPLVEDRKDPMRTTTYGVGLLIKDAVSRGVGEIILGLGGSATNDFGCGAAAALGMAFYDENGESFIPVGESLSRVARIERAEDVLGGARLTLMCDVENPTCGESGAAFVYAPQKGASPEQVKELDNGLRHICGLARRDLGRDVSALPGGGAAGGMAGGMVAFFGAVIRMGIDVVLDAVGFDSLLEAADVVLTGEGKIDSQSAKGKVVSGVAGRAKERGVPVVAVVGGIDGDMSAIYDCGVNSVFAINCMPEDLSVSRYKSEENLGKTMDNLIRILNITA